MADPDIQSRSVVKQILLGKTLNTRSIVKQVLLGPTTYVNNFKVEISGYYQQFSPPVDIKARSLIKQALITNTPYATANNFKVEISDLAQIQRNVNSFKVEISDLAQIQRNVNSFKVEISDESTLDIQPIYQVAYWFIED